MTPAHSPALFYLLKRGLYYRPNAAGYTANREEAGLFTEEYARADVLATAAEKNPEERVAMKAVKFTNHGRSAYQATLTIHGLGLMLYAENEAEARERIKAMVGGVFLLGYPKLTEPTLAQIEAWVERGRIIL